MAGIRQLELKDLDITFDLEEETSRDGFVISPEKAKEISETARELFEKSEKPPKWFEDYRFLHSQNWPWRVAVYIAWASSPKLLRWPETQFLLATQILGLNSDRVINTWRKKNPRIDTTITLLQAKEFYEKRRDVLDTLADMASMHDTKAAPDRRTYLTGSGDYVKNIKIEDKREKGNPVEMTDAELEEAIKRAEGEE